MIDLAEKPTRIGFGQNLARWSLEQQSPAIRYCFAVVCVLVALAGALACQYYAFRSVVSPLFDMAIVITAWYAGVGPSVLAVLLSTASASYFFVEPKYSFVVSRDDLPYFLVFTVWAAVIAWFVTVRRRIETELRHARDRHQIEAEEQIQRAELLNLTLNLTHDAILVRDMNAIITYWNRGAEELYGWSREQALGQRSHDLFQTVFPAPFPRSKPSCCRRGGGKANSNTRNPTEAASSCTADGPCGATRKDSPSRSLRRTTTSPTASAGRNKLSVSTSN